MENSKIYEVYFYNEYDDSENKSWYFRSEENAEKKYKSLCKKYGLKTGFCFSDEDWYTIWYSEVHFSD